MKKTVKRLLALVLSIIMCISLLPLTVFAEGTIEVTEEGTISIAAEEETAVPEEETEQKPDDAEEPGEEAPSEKTGLLTEDKASEERTEKEDSSDSAETVDEADGSAEDKLEESETEETYLAGTNETGSCGDNLTYHLAVDDDYYGVLTITGTGEMYDYTSNDAPWHWYDWYIDEVLISEGVTSIGVTAFKGFRDLKSIVLPSTVTSIGGYAFAGCLALESITVPDGLTFIGRDAFSGCAALSEIRIPDGVTSIGKEAFSGCESLSTVTIPDSVTTIGTYAFSGCSGLTSVSIPDSITEIETGTFSGCSSLKSVTIPDSVTTIQSSAFEECTELKEVTLSNNLSNISWHVFNGCTSLESITIPASVTWIGIPTFENCSNLTDISVESGNKDYCSVDGVLYNKAKTEFVAFPTGRSGTYEILDGVTSIESDAFYTCSLLEEVTLPDSLERINSWAFSKCTALKSIMIPDRVTTIEWNTFSGCTELENVTLPKNISYIPEEMCSECGKLKSIEIPDSVTSIGDGAFEKCSSLTVIVLPPDLTSLGSNAFYLCVNLTSIVIPIGITSFEQYALGRLDSLTDIYYEGSEEDWNSITSYYGNSEVQNANIHFNYQYIIKPLFLSDVKFHYFSSITDTVESYGSMYYNEDWFLQPSTVYNHELARMSIRMAMAAFGVPGTANEAGTARDDGRTRVTYNRSESSSSTSKNIVELFEQLRFKYIELFYEAPGTDTIGYAIASKQFQDENGETVTLIAVAVRGGGYEKEWASNFTVGTGGEHWGFSQAAGSVTDSVRSYIGDLGVEENLKIWMTGYSRAAATTNIAARVLTDYAASGTIKGLTNDSIFAYCFECPRGVQITSPSYYSANYNNIYSIVNYADVVPKVAPGGDAVMDISTGRWGYDRYGITYYLPAAELTGGFLGPYAYEVAEYRKILSKTSLGTGNDAIQYSTLGIAQGAVEDTIVSGLSQIFQGPASYRESFQDQMRGFGKSMGEQHVVSVGDILEGILATYSPTQLTYLSAKPYLEKIGYAHYPELCLAWMDALRGADEYCYNTRTRRLIVNCPVNVYVYDSSEKKVAEIAWDEVSDIWDSSIAAYIDENGQKIVILPIDEEYKVELYALDDGNVTYTVEEVDVDEVSTNRVISYYEVEVEAGDTLTGVVEDLAVVGTAEYPLVTESGEELTPNVDLSGSEIVSYTVSVSAEGAGTVVGGGLFVTGEFAQVTATPDDGAEFLGWYNGEKMVSEDAEYRFLVTEDVTLTAKFSEAGPGNTYILSDTELALVVGKGRLLKVTDEEGNAVTPDWASSDDGVAFVSSKGVVTANKVGTATITATVGDTVLTCDVRVQFKDVTDPSQFYYEPIYNMVDRGVLAGWEDGTFRPMNDCNRAAVVTFLWRLAGKPEPAAMATFSDMTDNPEFNKAISWAAEQGITTGYAGNLFKPWATCNRAAIVTFLWRYAGKPEPSSMATFKDMTDNEDFNNAISWAAENGITTGWAADNTFRPWNTCNRLAVASFLDRYDKL